MLYSERNNTEVLSSIFKKLLNSLQINNIDYISIYLEEMKEYLILINQNVTNILDNKTVSTTTLPNNDCDTINDRNYQEIVHMNDDHISKSKQQQGYHISCNSSSTNDKIYYDSNNINYSNNDNSNNEDLYDIQLVFYDLFQLPISTCEGYELLLFCIYCLKGYYLYYMFYLMFSIISLL